ncbi:MAG TPA: cytochrome c oxidase assembly protein [Nitriliruptorales bacterium]
MSHAEITWHAHPEAWALALSLVAGYVYALRRLGPLFHPRPGDPAATRGQKLAFAGAIVTLLVTSASPLHDVGEDLLFSAHMIQHLLDVFVVPPLLLLGTPRWLAELLLRDNRVAQTVRSLSSPVFAAVAFNGMLMLIHWPQVVDWMVAHEGFHLSSHLVLFLTAMLMWLPVASPTPKIPRLSPPAQMGYLFLMTILPTVPASFLTFGESPLYKAYEAVPRLWGIDALTDMQYAGVIMKLGGGLYLWTVIAVLFFRWAAGEERAERAGHAGTPAEPAPEPSTTNR